MLRRKKFYVIYPEYFEASISRKQGRRVPLDKATTDSTLKKLVFACKKLNLDHEVQKEKAFPNHWWEENGRILIPIDKKEKTPKSELIKQIGDITRRIKSKKSDSGKPSTKPDSRGPGAPTAFSKSRGKAAQLKKKKKKKAGKHDSS